MVFSFSNTGKDATFTYEQFCLCQAYEVHCNELKQVKLMKGITDGFPTQSIHPSDGRPLRVYSDIPAVTDLLSQPEFILGENDQDLSLRFVSCGLTSTLSSCWHQIPTRP
jgi:hypothetical protein